MFLSLLILQPGFPIAFCIRRFEREAPVIALMTARVNLKRMMGLSLLASLSFAALLCGASPVLAATAPSLGAASSFAVLGGASVTNTGITTINGDLGVWPGTITGDAMTVTGTTHQADTTAQNAQAAVTAAYDALVSQACTSGPLGATDLAGATLTPGVYCYSSTLENSGILTLNAGGDTNAVWVFKIGSTLTTASGSSVRVINGGQNSNVFWQVGSSATLGTTTAFAGNILALTSITVNGGATMSGRLLARNGTVSLDANSVSLFPIITVVKSVAAYSDPLNNTTSPKAIPGSVMTYSIQVTNSGAGTVDNNTTVITDQISTKLGMCVSTTCSNPPVTFSCSSSPTCGLSYSYATDVTYSNQVGGGAPYNYTPVSDATGYDDNVTGVRINPRGMLAGAAAAPFPSFTMNYRVRVK